MKTIVVGGGMSGLATAYFLEQEGVADITLLEAAPTLGGNIRTTVQDGFVIDGGPDSWVATKPQATALAKRIGLEADLIETIPENRHVYVAFEDELHPLPEGIVLTIPTSVAPIAASRLFTWDAKLRMALEPVVPARSWDGDADESIASFITRRLGEQMTERLAAPLLGGIFAGDAESISIRATFPQLIEAETKFGSLVKAMRHAKKQRGGGPPPSAFTSLQGGMGSFIDALVRSIKRTEIRTSCAVERIERVGTHFRVHTRGEAIDADNVCLAVPSHVAAASLRPLDEELATALDAFRYVSTATAFLGFRAEQVPGPLNASGFIVPRVLGRPILASTWVTSKWPHRAPADHVLIRVFFGGAWGEEVLHHGDEELVAMARRELAHWMKIHDEPILARVFRFHRANPQPYLGHLARWRALRQRLEIHPGLDILGSGFDGVGLSDCIRQAESVAKRLSARNATA